MSPRRKPTVCLNMIVKNEAPVIARCLQNVRPLIDSWVIVDTGSTDGTQDIIAETMRGLPGDLHERPWKNFGHNRTESIELAAGKADYILTIDADELLDYAPDFSWHGLSADAYLIEKRRGGLRYGVKNLVRDGLPWKWYGVLHEHLDAEGCGPAETLGGLVIMSPREGARARDPLTYKRDALVLEQALLEDPHNRRDVFYLAQSYRDCDDHELALRWYRRRAEMGGWSEEVYISRLNIARLLKAHGGSRAEVIAALLDAHDALPNRAEALYDLGMLYSGEEAWANAFMFLHAAMKAGGETDHVLFVDHEITEWRAALEAGVAAHYLCDWATAIEINEGLLAGDALPERLREQVAQNLRLAREGAARDA